MAASGSLLACGSDDDASDSTGPAATEGSDATAAPVATTESSAPAGSSATTAPGATTGPSPVSGGTLVYVPLSEGPGFDPVKSTVSLSHIQNFAVYDVLVYQPPGSDPAFRLMESADTTDGKTWTFTLKPGVEFSDGTAFNAEAVKFNWERLKDPANPGPSATIAKTIDTIEVVDDTSWEVTLVAPNVQFLAAVAESALTWIASPTAVTADPAGYNSKPVGAGPYLLEEWTPNSQTVFTRNPDYYGETYLDELILKIIPDPAQQAAALESGEVDVIRTPSAVLYNQTKDDFDSVVVQPGGGTGLFFNVQKAPFDDLKVRQAFAYAWDAVSLNDTIWGGAKAPVNNLFLPDSIFHDPKFDFPSTDKQKAQALFDEIAAERGEPLTVNFQYINPTFTAEAQWFQTYMAAFNNVTVNLVPITSADVAGKWLNGEVEFSIYSYAFFDGSDLAKYFQTGAAQNFMQFSDPDVDALLAQGVGELDPEKRVEIYAQIQQNLVDELPISLSLGATAWEIFNDNVHGIDLDHQLRPTGAMILTDVWVTP